jgi:hypothetical protein
MAHVDAIWPMGLSCPPGIGAAPSLKAAGTADRVSLHPPFRRLLRSARALESNTLDLSREDRRMPSYSTIQSFSHLQDFGIWARAIWPDR